MPEISRLPTIAVTIGRETHLYYAFVTTAPARLDGPRTMTLYVGTFADVSGWAARQLPCDAARANTPTRVVLVEAAEEHWHRTSYRSEGHVFAKADSILCLNTLQHWLWQRLYEPIVSDVGGHQTSAHSQVGRHDGSEANTGRSQGDHHDHDRNQDSAQ
jgi:hypothetical protein